MATHPNIIPGLRYKDAPKAIEWLCDVLGFSKHMVVPGDNNTIAHAQLKLGGGMIMLGSTRDDVIGRGIKSPADLDGFNTQSAYIVLPEKDLAAHYKRALAGGADIVTPLEGQDYGGKNYICRDLEGHFWSFGSYDPFD